MMFVSFVVWVVLSVVTAIAEAVFKLFRRSP